MQGHSVVLHADTSRKDATASAIPFFSYLLCFPNLRSAAKRAGCRRVCCLPCYGALGRAGSTCLIFTIGKGNNKNNRGYSARSRQARACSGLCGDARNNHCASACARPGTSDLHSRAESADRCDCATAKSRSKYAISCVRSCWKRATSLFILPEISCAAECAAGKFDVRQPADWQPQTIIAWQTSCYTACGCASLSPPPRNIPRKQLWPRPPCAAQS